LKTTARRNRSFTKSLPPVILLSLLSFFSFPTVLLAVDSSSNFYSLNPKWEKAQASGKNRQTALDDSFRQALGGQNFSLDQMPVTPAITRTAAELTARPVELELNQVLHVKPAGPVSKFLATDEGIVVLETSTPGTLEVVGSGIGSTFVHFWDDEGRHTFQAKVIPQKLILTPSLLNRIETIEKNRSFKIGYENSRQATYSGKTFPQKTRSSLDFNQNFTAFGDTPYGAVDSHIQTQKTQSKTVVTDFQVSLKDAEIGDFRHFNAAAGDSRVSPELIVFPSGRIRGIEIDHDDRSRARWMTFYGREQTSIIGTISPALTGGTKSTRDSYLSGGVLDFKLNDAARIKAGAFSGYGQARSDDQNRSGLGTKGEVKLGEHVTFQPEVDYDDEHFA